MQSVYTVCIKLVQSTCTYTSKIHVLRSGTPLANVHRHETDHGGKLHEQLSTILRTFKFDSAYIHWEREGRITVCGCWVGLCTVQQEYVRTTPHKHTQTHTCTVFTTVRMAPVRIHLGADLQEVAMHPSCSYYSSSSGTWAGSRNRILSADYEWWMKLTMCGIVLHHCSPVEECGEDLCWHIHNIDESIPGELHTLQSLLSFCLAWPNHCNRVCLSCSAISNSQSPSRCQHS